MPMGLIQLLVFLDTLYSLHRSNFILMTKVLATNIGNNCM